MRLAMIAAALLSTTAAAIAQSPVAAPYTAPTDRWHAKAHEIYEHAISIPTVQGRGQVPALAQYLAEQFRAGGFTDVTVHPYDVTLPDDHTAALIVRWPAAHPSGRKAMLLMGHMDVVEARREDWSRDPFTLGEADGYFYGRGTIDMKHGVTAVTTALLRLRAEGFQPDRDIIVLFTGDEENGGRGAETAANQWLDVSTIDFGLNADAGGGAFLADGRLLGFGIQTAEKIFQSFTFTATNPGGHSSRPRPDNAIYQLAHSLDRLEHFRFEPHLNDTTRAYFRHRTETASPELAGAINRWLANENDGQAADFIEASDYRGRPDPHALRRHAAAGRPCRQRAAPARPRDGQLPDVPGHGSGDGACDPAHARRARSCRRRADRARPSERRLAAARGRGRRLYRRRARPPSGRGGHSGHEHGRDRWPLFPRPRRAGLRRGRLLGRDSGRRACPWPRRAPAGARFLRGRRSLDRDGPHAC